MCDNFCLCKVKCLLGKTFRTILKEETISIDLVYTIRKKVSDHLSTKGFRIWIPSGISESPRRALTLQVRVSNNLSPVL
ncbi:MAG: hypothetical protein EWV66_09930 [Microcystis sp. M_OC_Ca_00000000_C217Col]|nr:MAG: hypothetical protein EWV66_09930 [Microcystis sp. M_OC_Ca_00000000_C217Col]